MIGQNFIQKSILRNYWVDKEEKELSYDLTSDLDHVHNQNVVNDEGREERLQ